MLLIDGEAALAAIPSMLPADTETRTRAFDLVKEVLGARGALSAADTQRLEQVGKLFNAGEVPFRRPAALRHEGSLDRAS